MFIHTVRSGDSLYSISRMYGYPVDQIRAVNGLESTNIVPGMALLIPLYQYTVQSGDTMIAIANRAMVTLQQLRAANPTVNPEALQVGMRLTIPNISNYLASTLGYYVARTPALDVALINDFAPYSSYIAIFDYQFAPNGDIVNILDDLPAVEAVWNNRVVPLITITNLTATGFSTQLASQVLNNPAARTNLVNNIVYLLRQKGYGGVNVDFELVAPADRDLYTGFLRQLRDRLKPLGLLLTVAVPAITEGITWHRGYDYGGIGSVVDFMFIMAYDWHHGASEPGPVAPISEVRRTIEYAIQRVPSRKIILGVPRYGYNWSIPYRPGTIAPGISNQYALNLAMRYSAPIQYSEEFQTPYFRYWDAQGGHEVWFEDVRSISEKFKLVRQYGLQGVGAWQLSLGFNAGPWLLRKFFTIRKV